MKIEIERRFLINGENWRQSARERRLVVQNYLSVEPERVVRVRITEGRGYLTVKGKKRGDACPEFEYSIPPDDAESMMLLCPYPSIKKWRYDVRANGNDWQIDEFEECLKGLCIAEIELPTAEQELTLPPWIGEEISRDPRYANARLLYDPPPFIDNLIVSRAR